MLQKVIQKSSKGWEVRSQLLLFAWNPSPLTLPTAPRHFPLGTIPLCHLLLVWLTPFPGESKAARVSNLVNKKSLCPDSPQLVDSKCKTQVGPVTINTETFGGVIRKYMFPLLPRGPKPVRWTHGATRIIFAALQSLSLNKSTWKKVKPEDWVGWRGGHYTLDSAIWIFTYILWSFFWLCEQINSPLQLVSVIFHWKWRPVYHLCFRDLFLYVPMPLSAMLCCAKMLQSCLTLQPYGP